jgi:hypothetical protein
MAMQIYIYRLQCLAVVTRARIFAARVVLNARIRPNGHISLRHVLLISIT